MAGPFGIGVGALRSLQIVCPHCKARQTRLQAATATIKCKYCHMPFPCPSKLKKK